MAGHTLPVATQYWNTISEMRGALLALASRKKRNCLKEAMATGVAKAERSRSTRRMAGVSCSVT